MQEIWKEYHRSYYNRSNKINSLFEVSNYGRIKKNGEIIQLKGFRNTPYYGCPCGTTVHRLVAQMFIPNPEKKPCIDHIDGNKHNNHVDNLRWVTYKENNNNPITKQRKSESLQKYFLTHDSAFKGKHHTEETKKLLRDKQKGIPRTTPVWNKGLKGWQTEETKQKSKKSWKETWNNKSDEEKREIYNKVAEKVKGNTNVKGRIHITNGIISKMINPIELDKYINEGWRKGRLMNKYSD